MMSIGKEALRFSIRELDSECYELVHRTGGTRHVVGTFYKNAPVSAMFKAVSEYHAQLSTEAK